MWAISLEILSILDTSLKIMNIKDYNLVHLPGARELIFVMPRCFLNIVYHKVMQAYELK